MRYILMKPGDERDLLDLEGPHCCPKWHNPSGQISTFNILIDRLEYGVVVAN
jgi:hypothetical protein